jgi:hypothetical protein
MIVIDDFSRAIAGIISGSILRLLFAPLLPRARGFGARNIHTGISVGPRGPIHRQRFRLYVEASGASRCRPEDTADLSTPGKPQGRGRVANL